MVSNDRFIQIRRQLHEIPEIGFQEFQTQRFILDYLSTLPQSRLEIKLWKTGILVKIPGKNPSKRIAYRADMDGLTISEAVESPFKSKIEGQMHACGHDFHMAIALGVLTFFVNHEVDDDLVFLFQPAEEGPGGALPMMESEEFKAYLPDQIVALHISPDYPVGTIATNAGILFANTSELYIELYGKEGHAAFPHKANDMIVAGASLIMQLQTIISRNINPVDAAVVTIGKLDGGMRQNVIADKVRLEGTIRTLSSDMMDVVKKRIEALVEGVKAGYHCDAMIDYGSSYYQVKNNSDMANEFMDWTRNNSSIEVIECEPAMTGEDFGYFLKEIPGFMFWLGVDSQYGLHHSKLQPKEEAIEAAISLLTKYLSWKAARQ